MPKTKGYCRPIFEFFVVSGLENGKELVCFDVNSSSDAEAADSDLTSLVSPLQQTYQASLLSSYPLKDPHGKLDPQALTALCFPHGVSLYEEIPDQPLTFHPFIITREDGSKVHAASLSFYEQVSDDVIEQINDLFKQFHRQLQKTSVGRLSNYRPLHSLYATKSICVVMSHPFHRASESLLRHILSVALHSAHSLPVSSTHPLPVESHIFNMLYEVPLPPPGRSTRMFSGKKSIICYRPGNEELPLLDYPLHTVLLMLGAHGLITLFKCAMLEQRILVKSSQYRRLMLVCECLNSLLFPFTWAHVYVPILPASMYHFLDAPVPFIMGLYQRESGVETEEISTCEMCLVDLEAGTVEPPEELPQFPHFSEMTSELEELCSLYGVELRGDNNEQNSDSGLSSQEGTSPQQANRISEMKSDIAKLGSSSRLAELEAIVKGVGVISSIEGDLKEVLNEKKQKEADDFKEKQSKNKALQDLKELKLSECIRQVFFRAQLRLFAHYEKFVIYPVQCDINSWIWSREMMSNFDKEAFLGDQSTVYQPFLCRFLETQMFASFIDNKIVSQWQHPDRGVKVFDISNKVKVTEENVDDHQKAVYEKLDNIELIEAMIDRRSSLTDYIALAPHVLEGEFTDGGDGMFPVLDSEALLPPIRDELSDSDDSDSRSADTTEPTERPRQPSLAFDNRTSNVSDTYLHFVQSLLKECKVRTKRMLVGKMGEEAVQLGHADPKLLGLEENTMIASLCDLMERIWSHGLIHKHHKSPLWFHLLQFSQISQFSDVSRNQVMDKLNSVDGGASTIADVSTFLPLESERTLTHRRKGSNPERPRSLDPLPDNLLVDIRHIQNMKEIKTEIGRARAFIRLSLEKKLLAAHLKELLANQELLRSLYRKFAFLRCEEESQQSLFHLLSLNTADFRCFTNSFTSADMSYRVLVFPGKRFAGGISTTTANVWVSVAGKLRDSERKWLPRNCHDFTFESKNLGELSTVRIGHDNSGMAPKWLVDSVVVRNETTGQVAKFPCGRWLGRGVDDDSTERILVGEIIPHSQNIDSDLTQGSPRRQKDSPKPTRRLGGVKKCKSHMQQLLTDSVNNLIKYFHKSEKERESITLLLCGDNGLVTSLEMMFSLGFKSSRIFRNNLYIWDYLENVQKHLLSHDTDLCRSLLANLTIINNSLQDVGKDGKLQLLLCIAVRDHLLTEWLTYLSVCPITKQMYEDTAFLLDEPQIQFLVNLVSMLRSYHVTLEPSITKGLDI